MAYIHVYMFIYTGGAAYMAAPRQQPVPNWNQAGVPRVPAATPFQQAEQCR